MDRMHIYCLVIFALLSCLARPVATRAQSQPFVQGDDAEFARIFGMPTSLYDIYSFKSEKTEQSELRVYVAFVNDILQFVRGADRIFRARYEIAVEILDIDSQRQDGEITTHVVTAQRYEETNSRAIANHHRFKFDLKPGPYDVILEITDQATKRRLRRKKRFELRAFSEDALGVSDIIFVSNRGTDRGWFPVLHKTFEDPLAAFDAHFEIYASGVPQVQLRATLVNTNNKIVYQYKTAAKLGEGRIFEKLALNESLHQAGLYRLRLELTTDQDSLSVEEVFLNQYTRAQEIDDTASSNELLHALKYVSSAEDYSAIASAGESEQAALMDVFWKRRDPTPGTIENELKGEFLRRVRFAMQHFSSSSKDGQGWQTDRGRIYITYGAPTDLRRRSMDTDSNPYEIWYYGHVDRRFVFMDKSGNGVFKLVHQD
ncbi:GWxTD domain-containing protein [bacterium]|nr:GWxTD domain-containing protein [bacterium]